VSSVHERWKYPEGEEPGFRTADLADVLQVRRLTGLPEAEQRQAIDAAYEAGGLFEWEMALLE